MHTIEDAPQGRHIIVAGFMGSGHQELADTIAEIVGGEHISTYTAFAARAMGTGDFVTATQHEVAAVNALPTRSSDTLNVVDVGLPAFCHANAQKVIHNLGAATVYAFRNLADCRIALNTAAGLGEAERHTLADMLGLYTFDQCDRIARERACLTANIKHGVPMHTLAHQALGCLAGQGYNMPILVNA